MLQLKSVPYWTGALVVLLASLALIGWIFDVGILKSAVPGLVSMKANTAVCLVLAGCSLLLQASGEPVPAGRLRVARVIAVLLMIAGVLTLFEYAFDLDFGLDDLLFRRPVEPGDVFPGRMSPASSADVVLLGWALFVLDVPSRRARRWPAQSFALAAAIVTLLAFIAYFYGVETPYLVGQYFSIALNTVVGFWLLCLGILFARPTRGVMGVFVGDNLGGLLARRMLPAAILVPLLSGWIRVFGQRAGLYGLGFGSALSSTLLIVTFTALVIWAARALNRADAARRQGLLEGERREQARRMELEALMEGAPVLVWIAHDAACQRITGNRAAQEMLRVAPDANVSKTGPEEPQLEHFKIYRDGVALNNEDLPIQLAGRAGKPVLGQELELRFSDNTTHWIYGNAVPLLRADGSVRGVVSAFVDITALKQAEQELNVSRQNLRGLAARLQAVREEERTGLAREIHDVLAQELTRLKIDITWVSRQLSHPQVEPSKQSALRQKLAGMAEITDTAIASVQKIATELRPVVLDSLGLCAAIEWQARDFQARTGIECTVDVPEADLHLERDRSTALFRILQESLTNVARHAKATRVEVELNCDETWASLRVQDNGRGIRPSELSDPRSVGLLGMRERAALLGGECKIEGRVTGGTCVEARVALAAKVLTTDKH